MRRAVEPIWLFNALITGAGLALFWLVVRHYAPAQAPALPWWLLAPAVLATERRPVELHFGRSAHSFSLTDITVTLALVFSSGGGAMAGVTLGAGAALALRRLPAVKLAFNVGQFLLVTGISVLIVRIGIDHDPHFGWITWLAVLAATQAGGLVTIALLLGAIVITEGGVSRTQVRQMFGMDLLVTTTATSMALICAVLWVARPAATPLLIIPILVAFFGYRAYVAERQGHEQVKFLYEANRTLSGSPEVAVALEGLLERALEAFRAEQAEVILFGVDGAIPLRTSLGPHGAREAMTPVAPGAAGAVRAVAEAAPGAARLAPPFADAVESYFTERGVRHALLAVLRGENRVIGTVMLANRFGLGRGFTEDDRALFDTLAANASAASSTTGSSRRSPTCASCRTSSSTRPRTTP